ncbi:MAG: chitobiase/beta-hexosaminidase C-terminal domain-containing protein [Pontiellaceae bacterium]|nr:chitobiase/beta-hexosaminidase C-terminal domain-containing protein [Pontiellaceae bacterium]MBN2785638.1 chitobiase/beta-hexosaminidase C-terminal domain-containing protein [Pontiellaceae bacterium]
MKKTTLILACCGLLSAHADFVYRSGTDFLTTADLDGDGRSDLVLVDGSNATVRVGYQLTAGQATWAAPRTLGLDSVTDITCGNILNTGYDVLVAAAPMLNRCQLYTLAKPTSPAVPSAIYSTGIGPESVAAIDIGGTGNTANDDLVAVSIMNGSSPYRATRIRSNGTTLSYLGTSTISPSWKHLNAVEYAAGLEGLTELDSNGTLRIYSFSSGSLQHLAAAYPGLGGAADYVAYIPDGASSVHVLVYLPGQSQLKVYVLTEPSAGSYAFASPISYDLGSPIDSVQMVDGNGTTRLAIIFKDGQSVALYDYDGSGAPTYMQDLEPPLGQLAIAAVALGSDDFVLISSDTGDLSGALTAEAFSYSGSSFVSSGSELLAAQRIVAQANVMTFAGEPFVDTTPQRLQLLRGGDWSSSSMLSGGSVIAVTETDAGLPTGLANPQGVALGTADASALYTLDNQPHAAISTYCFEPARGDEVVGIILNPDPGNYGTTISVSLTPQSAATVYYRTGTTGAWTKYTAPFLLFKDTTVQYYASTTSGQSIIREALYTFSENPSNLDSDGDGVPDYVEIAYGLDPVESGLDSDGDGVSDLDELLNGSSPTNSASVITNRTEQASVYDLSLTPRPYDGVLNTTGKAALNTQIHLYSASGGLRGYAKAANVSVSGVTITNPTTYFDALPRAEEPPFLTAVSDSRFDVYGISADNQRGVELVGVYLQPDSTSVEVAYDYQGGALATEAANWLAVAQSAYAAQLRDVLVADIGLNDVLAGMLLERKLADLLYERGSITNNWISLFKGRSSDGAMNGFRASDLQSLESEGPSGEAAYYLPGMVAYFRTQAAALPELQTLVRDLYDSCSDYGRNASNAGKYPLPVDELRSFLYSGTLNSNYLAVSSQSVSEISDAFQEATEILASVPQRPYATYTLSVRTNSFDAVCPVLYSLGGVPMSLYSAGGSAYRFPVTFTLQPGAQVSVTAYTDMSWDLCPGTDPLEVIELSLTALPVASGSDVDGNLLPDDYESMFLTGGNGVASSDSDGDGYSDLQEYLEQTDPNDAGDMPAVAIADLSPPTVHIGSLSASTAQVDIDWPEAYADAFIFTLVSSSDLVNGTFEEDIELPEGSLSGEVDISAEDVGYYRVQMQLR